MQQLLLCDFETREQKMCKCITEIVLQLIFRHSIGSKIQIIVDSDLFFYFNQNTHVSFSYPYGYPSVCDLGLLNYYHIPITISKLSIRKAYSNGPGRTILKFYSRSKTSKQFRRLSSLQYQQYQVAKN